MDVRKDEQVVREKGIECGFPEAARLKQELLEHDLQVLGTKSCGIPLDMTQHVTGRGS